MVAVTLIMTHLRCLCVIWICYLDWFDYRILKPIVIYCIPLKTVLLMNAVEYERVGVTCA
jgi:hypothetical protein